MRVYIDSHTESLLVNYGVEVFSTMLGAAIGAAIGSAPGAAAGTIIGFLISPVLSELYSFVCEQSSMDNGIWIDIKVRGHFSIFGHTIYYSLPPGLWLFKGYGIQ